MSRLRWPVAPYSALATAALTLALVPFGALSPAPAPEATLTVSASVQGETPLGPTQDQLRAALRDVRVAQPLDVVILGEGEKPPEERGENTLYVSLALSETRLTAPSVYAPRGAPSEARTASFNALYGATRMDARATAVAAAALAYDRALNAPPRFTPTRVALIGIGAGLSLALLVWFLLRTSTWRDRRAAVRSARADVAGVVLQLQDLELTHAVRRGGQVGLPPRIAQLNRLCLDLLAREEDVRQAVSRPRRAASPRGRSLRALYVADAARAKMLARDVSLGQSLLGEFAGARGAWDRAVAGTVFSATQLLSELSAAAPAVRAVAQPARGREALDELLSVGRSFDRASVPPDAALARLRSTEDRLRAWARNLSQALDGRGLSRSLSARPPALVPDAVPRALRAELGLSPQDPAEDLENARAAVAAYAGRVPDRADTLIEFEATRGFDPDPRRGRDGTTAGAGGVMARRVVPLVGAAVLGLTVLGGSWLLSGRMVPDPRYGGVQDTMGSERLGPVSVQGRALGLDQTTLANAARVLPVPAPLEVHVVGISSPATAPDRISRPTDPNADPRVRLSLAEARSAYRQALETTPGLLDAATGDLRQGQAIVLVDGPTGEPGGAIIASAYGVGTAASGRELSSGAGMDYSRDLPVWDREHLPDEVTSEFAALARAQALDQGLSTREYFDPARRWGVWAILVAAGSALSALVAGAVIGGMRLVRGTGRLGRSLRASARGLRALNLDLDTARLDAEVVLARGRSGAASEDQRLVESWGIQALREHERLDGLRGARRRDPATLARAARLEKLVEALRARDLAAARESSLALRPAGLGPADTAAGTGATL